MGYSGFSCLCSSVIKSLNFKYKACVFSLLGTFKHGLFSVIFQVVFPIYTPFALQKKSLEMGYCLIIYLRLGKLL